jgi:hypothetical protein
MIFNTSDDSHRRMRHRLVVHDGLWSFYVHRRGLRIRMFDNRW